MSDPTYYTLTSIPAGTRIEQDPDGYYFVLPDGTTRRVLPLWPTALRLHVWNSAPASRGACLSRGLPL